MRYTVASLALAALATAKPMPGGVTSAVAPAGSAPAGCQSSYSGSFEIEVVNASTSSKRSVINKRDITLVMTLSNGILTDSEGRTGYIASNYQFQFDKPPQAGAIYTAGWSVCSNGSLTLGDDSVFYECLSGTFYNLYDKDWAAQCSPIYIEVIGSSSAATTAAASQISDGQITASPQPICEYKDGQPQATNCVSQTSDGQVQAPTATASAVCETVDGQPQAGCSTTSAVCEYIDGQPQAGCSSTAMPMTTSTSAVCEYVDGQPQAGCSSAPMTTTSAVCEYIDGQPQAGCSSAPMTTSSAVCEYSDGQPQAGCSSTIMSMTTTSAVCEYVDGQPQAGCSTTMTTSAQITSAANATVTTASASVTPYTGAAMPTALRGEIFGLAAGVLAVAML